MANFSQRYATGDSNIAGAFYFSTVAAVDYAATKVMFSADGDAPVHVSTANPLPVTAATMPLPSGAATAANQTSGNVSLASIDGKITAVNTGAVVVSSSALPSGASTAAKQPALGVAGTASTDVLTIQGIASMTPLLATLSGTNNIATVTTVTTVSTITNVVHVDDNAGSLTVDAPVGTPVFVRLSDGAAAITTLAVSLASLPALVAGTANIGDVDVASIAAGDNNIGNVDVVTLPALATGDNTVGRVKLTDGTAVATVRDLAANDALNVAIVDAAGDQITSFGGGTQYTEDAAAAANPVGTVPILVRADTPGTLVTTDGDNVGQRGSNYGAAYVTLIDNAGAFVAVGGGTQYDEDAVHASGNKVTMAGVVRLDSPASTSGASGDVSCLVTDSTGRLYVREANSLTIANAVQVHDNAIGTQGFGVIGRASAAAPADVSADNDAVSVWALRNGSLVTNIAAGGTLITATSTSLNVNVSNASLTVATHDVGTVTTVTTVGTVSSVAAVTPGTAATNLGKAEDTVHGSGDVGVYMLAVRDDALAAHSGTDGDYESLHTNADGALWTKHSGAIDAAQSGSWTVTANAGTNLNTSALAVETGGNLATIAGAVRAEDVASAGGHTGLVVMARRTDTPADQSGTDGDYEFLQVKGGRLWVDPSGVTLTVASHAVTNAGTFVTQVDGAALTALQLIDDIVGVEDAAETAGGGLARMGAVRRDTLANSAGTTGDNCTINTTAEGALWTATAATTNGGASPIKILDSDETEDEVKATAGQIYSLVLINTTNALLYVKLYNLTAANTTVGTSTPVMTIPVPANNDTDGAGVAVPLPAPLAFDTAITIATTTGLADNDTGAPGANAMTISGTFK